MDEENNNKRLLMAAGLCFLVMVVWNFAVPPPASKPGALPSAGAGTSTVAVATSTGSIGGDGAAELDPAPEMKAEPPQLFTFRGEVHNADTGEDVPFEVRLTNVGGGIDRFELPSYNERDGDNHKTDQPITLAMSVLEEPTLFGQMAGLDFVDDSTFKLPPRPVYEVAQAQGSEVRYRYVTREGVEIEREYRLDPESFQVELAVTVRNRSDKRHSYRLQLSSALQANSAMKAGGGFLSGFVPPPDHLNALCHTAGKVERIDLKNLPPSSAKPETFSDAVRWTAIDRQYFISALIPRDGTDAECRLSVKNELARASILPKAETLEPGEKRRHKFTAYLGVKKPAMLTLVNAELETSIDYTILGMNLAFLCAALLWILKLFHGWFNSWGLAILGLTVVVKATLFPLNQRSGRSMRAMAALKPKLDELRDRFPEDKQRQSEEMMKLYREHNVNPAGGCLPVLIQMPIWFALYRSLWVSVDLFQQSFLWMPDLTARDPYWVLPVLLVIVMFLQQKMTPSTMDPAQQKIMLYTMPLFFGAMMIALPAGLCFYILVNTLLTILQQHFINKSVGPIGGSAAVRGATA